MSAEDLKLVCADNLLWFSMRSESEPYDLIYIDPPFNTGKTQTSHSGSFEDSYDDLPKFLEPRLGCAYEALKANGTFLIHLDYREVHYVKVLLDRIFGRASFLNEIIWAYDYGGRPKNRWPAKHDNILVYVKDPKNYTFNYEQMDRIPYMAPGLCGPEKAALGKTPTDVHWHTIVPTNGSERTGYPTQKPLGLLERFVKIHSNEGDRCLDFFAGSGSFGEACIRNKRKCTLVDVSSEALRVMQKRFQNVESRSTTQLFG